MLTDDRGAGPRASLSVGIACSSRELFGADRSAVRLALVLQSLGHRPVLLLPSGRPELGLRDFALSRGVAVQDAAMVIVSSSGVEGARAFLRPRDRPIFDLVVYNTTAVLAVAARGRSRISMIREWLRPDDLRHRAISAVIARRRHAVVGISSGVIDQWKACQPGSQLPAELVPNWLDPEDRAEIGPNRGVGLLCLGRFNAWKGQEDLAEAFTLAASSRDSPVPLVFVGAEANGPRAELAERLRREGQASNLWSVEPFTATPGAYLEGARLLVVPSKRPEPFGMVILEALAAGARVLAYEGGGPDDLAAAFPGVVATAQRNVPALRLALEEWLDEGAPAQTDEQRLSTEATLDAQYSRGAAAANWNRTLKRLGLIA